MPERRVLLVDAFTDRPLSGNAAGVVPGADGLDRETMQAIAREVGASETAFLLECDGEDRRIRYFTPTTEVDLCGHATVASHAHLAADGVIGPGTHALRTNVGTLEVEVKPDGTIWMTQNEPAIERIGVDAERIASALGVDAGDLGDHPPAVASTGLPFLVVGVASRAALHGAAPDFEAVEALSEDVGATGVYAFTTDVVDPDSTLHARAFAPLAGVPEDPVTGTASGAAGAYLRAIDAAGFSADVMRFEQGHAVDRPGTVLVRVGETVRVGGRAVTALDGTMALP